MPRGVFVAFGLLLTDLCLDYVLSVLVRFLASLVTEGLWIPFATSSNMFQYTCLLYPRARVRPRWWLITSSSDDPVPVLRRQLPVVFKQLRLLKSVPDSIVCPVRSGFFNGIHIFLPRISDKLIVAVCWGTYAKKKSLWTETRVGQYPFSKRTLLEARFFSSPSFDANWNCYQRLELSEPRGVLTIGRTSRNGKGGIKNGNHWRRNGG